MLYKEIVSKYNFNMRNVLNLINVLNNEYNNEDIYIKFKDKIVDAHSAFGILSLKINKGDIFYILSKSQNIINNIDKLISLS